MGMINVHDININLDDNCNDCCPCIPSKKTKPPKSPKPIESKAEEQKKIDLTDKVKKTSCNIG